MWIGRNRKMELFHQSRAKPDWLQHPVEQIDHDLQRRGSCMDSPPRRPRSAHIQASDGIHVGSDDARAGTLSQDPIEPWPMPPNARIEPSSLTPADRNKPLPLLPPDGVRRYRRMTPNTAGNTTKRVRTEGSGLSIQQRRRRAPLPQIFIPPFAISDDVEAGAETGSDHSDPASMIPAVPTPLPVRNSSWRLFPEPPPTRTREMRRILGEENSTYPKGA
ncbi:MAG: hypothetical protein Q9191_008142 [Dirinaria sp. TL-2023a]